MKGVLVAKSVKQASGMKACAQKVIRLPYGEGMALSANDAVIGIYESKGEWWVSFTAKVAKAPGPRSKREDVVLKSYFSWSKSRSWRLPVGVPSSSDFGSLGYELLSEDGMTDACLIGSDALSCLQKSPPQRNVFHPSRSALDHLAVVFEGGEPRVWDRSALESCTVESLALYERAVERFLRDLPRSKKGFVFEEILEELLRLSCFAFGDVKRTAPTGDGGVDLCCRRATALGEEVVLVQAKNLVKPVEPAVVQQLHGVRAQQRASRAVLVSTGGFSEGAKQVAAQLDPIVHLVDLRQLTTLICTNIHNMPYTAGQLLSHSSRPGQHPLF